MSGAAPEPAGAAGQDPISVLFVDDEANIRTGLRRMLHGMRGVWDMRFADGGEQALEMMRAAPADVVVSDMRMPGMNGRELLAAIERSFPRTVRIVLSGQSDHEMALRLGGGAHIFLSKPCEAGKLIDAVTRAWRLRKMYGDPRIAQVVAELPRLPRLPAIYHELVSASPTADMSVDRLARIIAQDQELLTGTLELANAAPTLDGRAFTSLPEVMRQHGTAAVQGMVLTAALLRELDDPALRRESLDHAMTAALLARGIAHEIGLGRHELSAAFSAGLLHDLGLLLFEGLFPKRSIGLVSELCHDGMQLVDLERQVVGATHAEVGAHLLASLGLPDLVVEAVALHHDCAAAEAEPSGVAVAVHAAAAIVDCDTPDQAFFERLGLSQLIDRWRARAGSSETSPPASAPSSTIRAN